MTETKEIKSKGLYQALWNSADILRSKMDANEYKSYLLGLVFYKYLSDKMLYYVADQLDEITENLHAAQKIYESAIENEELHDDLIDNVKDEFSYYIEPNLTFTKLVDSIHGSHVKSRNFQIRK